MAEVARHPSEVRLRPAALADPRFRRLVGADAWQRLPVEVRRRFAKRLGESDCAVYRGRVTVTRHSRFGSWLARIARIVGGPLPLPESHGGAAIVTVTEDAGAGGQIWTRIYARRGRFPQTVNSVKQFAGPTGLQENLGFGIAMQLVVREEAGALVFASAGYRLCVGGWSFRLPSLFDRLACEVRHTPMADGTFRFTLRVSVPRFGELVYQEAQFRDDIEI